MIPGYVMQDNFKEFSPDDSDLWLALFYFAEKHYGRDLCDRLQYLRNSGSQLVENPKFGFVIKPVIAEYAWQSQEQYDDEKQCLNRYRDDVVKLLKTLAQAAGKGCGS